MKKEDLHPDADPFTVVYQAAELYHRMAEDATRSFTPEERARFWQRTGYLAGIEEQKALRHNAAAGFNPNDY